MEMFEGHCPHCRSVIQIGYVPADVSLYCESCDKPFRLREAYHFRSFTLLNKQIDKLDGSEIVISGAQLKSNQSKPSSDQPKVLEGPSGDTSSKTAIRSVPTSDTSAIEKPSSLRWLPVAFYVIACLGFIGWIIIALNLESWVAFGYGVGSTIACFAGGRTIELLQNIDDELYRKRMSR